MPDLHHVLHQADGTVIGFVQFADDEQQVRAEGWRGCVLPQQNWQVHGHGQGQQGVGEGLRDESELSREAQGAESSEGRAPASKGKELPQAQDLRPSTARPRKEGRASIQAPQLHFADLGSV